MKVGLYDVDSHNFPNLPLMKISAYHKLKGDEVETYQPLLWNKRHLIRRQTMKILKQGNYKPTEYLFKCKRCGCVFTEEVNNVVTVVDLFSFNKYSFSCDCPCCECSCTSDTIYTEEKDGDENS